MKKEYLCNFSGELFGTFILVFFGCSAVAVSVLFGAHIGLFQVAAVWGIGVSLAIYATRHLSCAHINPAVSIAMVIARRMTIKKLPTYLLAQLMGAFLAGFFVYLLFSDSIANFELIHNIVRGQPDSVVSAMIFGEYFPNPSSPQAICSVSLSTAFLAEMLGTFLLVSMIFLLTEGCNVGKPDSDFAPILIGATVAAIICIISPLTQAGINPARDFGPRLFSYFAGWKSIAIPGPRGGFFTVYILGPVLGGTIAALLFTKLIQPLMGVKKDYCV
ncbi:MAG: aquaporin family protein [Candidatus Omnitrophica bacterium]|nr:aquaporin family protein [Candidatus Omnitrophota bacterium]